MDHDTDQLRNEDQRPEPPPFTAELRRRRTKADLSQKELARLSGVSEGWIRILEAGRHRTRTGWKQSIPNPKHTILLAQVLGWDPDDALRVAGHDPDLVPDACQETLEERIQRLERMVLYGIEEPAIAS